VNTTLTKELNSASDLIIEDTTKDQVDPQLQTMATLRKQGENESAHRGLGLANRTSRAGQDLLAKKVKDWVRGHRFGSSK
jgi:hypothetical protein